MIRKRIAAAVGIVALAVTGPLLAAGTAEASTPSTPYMCPYLTSDSSSSLSSWATGQGQIVCWYYGKPSPCRYNAWLNGDDWYYYQPSYGPNPSYCPARAIPTAP
ncbi:hypothetical protein DQ384_14995 [Sphaerisporangium album]|uniref:Secreted protein n=1 Tax=Sphaerisporangium album TaxID=509200 RepID=A0A367FL33_9ACTN|nr:hypothetical protein [Sphaerisporangium album]RCG30599.1 hypothetical protein DQ384_14995 [Sphaerisporangium album]